MSRYELYYLVLYAQPDRVRYVGVTTVGVNKRFSEHLNHALSNSSRLPVARWIVKHNGRAGVACIPVQTVETLDSLHELEVSEISRLRLVGQADLNVAAGGGGSVGYKHTDEFRKRISDTHKGKVVSETTRLRISNAKAGQKINRDPSTFPSKTDECKQRISDALKGCKKPEGHGANVSFGLRNKHGMAKLDESQARDILRRVRLGESARSLSEEFGVATNMVSRIKTGARWGYLQYETV